MKTNTYFFLNRVPLISFQNEKSFRQKLKRKSKQNLMFNNFLSENRAVYEIMWKNMLKPYKPQMTM